MALDGFPGGASSLPVIYGKNGVGSCLTGRVGILFLQKIDSDIKG
jgi:hypothetical protein